ncbi:hypothetical protein [Streptomyces sp. NBC_01462]|uniref:hypothetical protein n=1 Tax=Streptomyces sp. NBC_01462 TaxID=2903876 RepID=UPI002E2F10D0|nr:hypothetical protein [Streptomyces sp. NBC_01462]
MRDDHGQARQHATEKASATADQPVAASLRGGWILLIEIADLRLPLPGDCTLDALARPLTTLEAW